MSELGTTPLYCIFPIGLVAATFTIELPRLLTTSVITEF
jgi:hypothetical protein